MSWKVGCKVACNDPLRGYVEGYVEAISSTLNSGYAMIMVLPNKAMNAMNYGQEAGSLGSLQRRGWHVVEAI
jgi:hypothetical protein